MRQLADLLQFRSGITLLRDAQDRDFQILWSDTLRPRALSHSPVSTSYHRFCEEISVQFCRIWSQQNKPTTADQQTTFMICSGFQTSQSSHNYVTGACLQKAVIDIARSNIFLRLVPTQPFNRDKRLTGIGNLITGNWPPHRQYLQNLQGFQHGYRFHAKLARLCE